MACVACRTTGQLEVGQRVSGVETTVVYGQHSEKMQPWGRPADAPPLLLADLPDLPYENLRVPERVVLPLRRADATYMEVAYELVAAVQYDGGHFAVDVRGVANPRSWCRVDDLAGPAGAAVARPDGSLSQMASREGNPCWPVLVAYARVV